MGDTLQERRFKGMTVGIAVACKDGVLVGADRKVTMFRGTRIKSLENKVFKLSFRDGRNLLVCGSGGTDLTRRALDAIDPTEFDRDIDCALYRDMIESRISRLESRLSERGLEYNATLLFGMIDTDDKPVIGYVIPTGLTEIRNEGYFTTGIAAPYAELVLKDSYTPQMSITDARLIVGGLIEKIGNVDNDVEGMDVSYISVANKEVKELTWSERQGIKDNPPSLNFGRELDKLKKAIDGWHKLMKQWDKSIEKKSKEA